MSRGKLVTMRLKPFSYSPLRTHRVWVYAGQVRVWDEIAGYWTVCHSLSRHQIRRIKLAAAERGVQATERAL